MKNFRVKIKTISTVELDVKAGSKADAYIAAKEIKQIIAFASPHVTDSFELSREVFELPTPDPEKEQASLFNIQSLDRFDG